MILEIATNEDFISAVLSRPLDVDNEALRYHSLYNHDFVFELTENIDSTIDGEHYVKQISYSLKSPFINGKWDSDAVAISYDGETHIPDFSA